MDKIEKSLQKLSRKEQKRVKEILEKLYADDAKGLDIKKLAGREDIFRMRRGDIRIIYRIHSNQVFILAIERKNESMYK